MPATNVTPESPTPATTQLFAAKEHFIPKRFIQPPSVHGSGTYSHGVLTSAGLLFLSGQVAKNVKNQSIGLGDFEAQAIQIFENIRLILAEAGGSMADIVKINVYLTDGRYIDTYRAVRARYFSDPNPASTGVVVAGLASPEWLLEIEVVADLG